MVKIQLQVPKYLKKILVTKYGDNFILKENTLLGMAICNVLMSKNYAVHRYRKNEKLKMLYRYKELSESFNIRLSVNKAIRKGFEINDNKLHKIVRGIDKSIREDLYKTAINNKEFYDIEYQTTFYNFLDEYDITEEELSYESLRKDFNRRKEKLTENLFK